MARVPKVAGENIRNFLARWIHNSPDFSISFSRSASLYCEENLCMSVCVCVCVCVYLTAWRPLRITVATNNSASETFWHKSGAFFFSFDWKFTTGTPARRRMSEYVTLDEMFYNFLFKQEIVAAPISIYIFFFIAFFEEVFIRNIIILWTYYALQNSKDYAKTFSEFVKILGTHNQNFRQTFNRI